MEMMRRRVSFDDGSSPEVARYCDGEEAFEEATTPSSIPPAASPLIGDNTSDDVDGPGMLEPQGIEAALLKAMLTDDRTPDSDGGAGAGTWQAALAEQLASLALVAGGAEAPVAAADAVEGLPAGVEHFALDAADESSLMDPALEEWAKGLVKVHEHLRGGVTVDLGGRGLDDEKLCRWCEWASAGLPSVFSRRPRDISLDVSKNQVGDEGVAALAELLKGIGVPVCKLLLHENRIGKGGCEALAGLMLDLPVAELHLSHNRVDLEGAIALLKATAEATDPSGSPLYPLRSAIPSESPKPLWLRLERNIITAGGHGSLSDVLRKANNELIEHRRNLGFLMRTAAPHQTPMLCEAPKGYGCNSLRCSCLHGRHVGSSGGVVADGPLAHVPWILSQYASVEEATSSMCGESPASRVSSSGAGTAVSSYSSGRGSGGMAASYGRPRYSYGGYGEHRRQSRRSWQPTRSICASLLDSMCGEKGGGWSRKGGKGGGKGGKGRWGKGRECVSAPMDSNDPWSWYRQQRGEDLEGDDGGEAEADDGSSDTTELPPEEAPPGAEQPRQEEPAEEPAPPRKPPCRRPMLEAGARARVMVAVVGDEWIPDGFSTDNYLTPIKRLEELQVEYVGPAESDDYGWIWATVTDGRAGWIPTAVVQAV
eukprot:TRINITY_DN26101_c0_g1_i1.p1 TRINITY_DN26101_c0_g1~~TRINITY_DN26101_c0_g1_i1.p1  ORF type:complete len:653 (-),score=157.92 TRINITY_DN26101_c0_g1_i1:89-2047(-)